MKGHPRRILIIDDDVAFSSSLQKILSKAGYETVLADSGEQGLQLLTSRMFDLVITDFRLGSFSGLDVISCIQNQKIPVKILLLTAFGDEKPSKATEQGAVDARLSKPVKRDEILGRVSLLLSEESAKRSEGEPVSSESPAPRTARS
ncbi:MAG: response regulator [Acidobacteria bacterium]|nr:response regulator [Acidobacteriota bacterium]